MENEAFSEYFQRKNKLSLVMWVLINNNIVTRNIYLAMMCFDFLITFLIILCLYNSVNSIPLLSEALVEVIDYSDPSILAIVAIVQAAILLSALAVISLIMAKRYSWKTYSEKKLFF